MKKAQKSYSTHGVIAFLAIAFPFIAGIFKQDDTPNLKGIVISKEKPVLNASEWFSGSYQKLRDDYNADHWAFKEISVRANNQLYYDAFNQIRVKGFVSGKEDYVFSESYIFSAFGDDLMPESKVSSLLEKARLVQDSLRAKGVDLLLVYVPGKGVGAREFVEDKYLHPVKQTNHALFIKHSKRLGLNHVDFYTWLTGLKPESPYPLFTKFGHHWSYFAECLVVDSLIGHIEHLRGVDLPDIGWRKIEISDTARSRDADVLASMNLLRDPQHQKGLAYPEVVFETAPEKNTTRVLTISDSYWYGPIYMGVPQYCFAGGQFWYYYNRVVPSPKPGEAVEVWELDLRKELESNNVVMILYSDANLPDFGNNFIHDAYRMYTDRAGYEKQAAENRQVQFYAKQIRGAPLLLKQATRLSEELQIPLDSAIKIEARKRVKF